MLAVDVSPWLRPDAATSGDRLFCHVYGRAKGNAQLIPGWPYSFVAALETGRSSWTAVINHPLVATSSLFRMPVCSPCDPQSSASTPGGHDTRNGLIATRPQWLTQGYVAPKH